MEEWGNEQHEEQARKLETEKGGRKGVYVIMSL
jgi:hypothetical protein